LKLQKKEYILKPLLSRALCLSAVITFSAGCGSEPKETTTTEEENSAAGIFVADSSGEISAAYLTTAESLVSTFQGELKDSLKMAIREKGAARAIEYCKVVAPQLTEAQSREGWKIRRVTARFRNPDNRADSAELAILAQFSNPDDFVPYISSWSRHDSGWTYQFYEPIRTNKLCLNCHGGIQTLASGVFDALKRHYPRDRATGYTSGQIRGMFAIEANWPPAEPSLDTLADSLSDLMTDSSIVEEEELEPVDSLGDTQN